MAKKCLREMVDMGAPIVIAGVENGQSGPAGLFAAVGDGCAAMKRPILVFSRV
jgi:hypothetical protein